VNTPTEERVLFFPGVWERKRASAVGLSEAFELHLPSDEEVMACLQDKDSNALDVFFRRYSRLVFGIALGIVCDRGEAEDVVQEVFFYLYRKAKVFDASKGTAKSWIVQVAYHRAFDRRAYLNRRGFYSGTEIESLDDTLLGETDLDREIGAKLNREQLEKAFEELPEMQRRTLELFFFAGLDLREISEKLNEPWGNIRHHFYRGLERLRKSAFARELGGG
jgi:RNA polymerase sigma-70 factor (ECF subfamily)